ncbi:acyl-CoA thioesterase [Marihabitans asiaticum]|uniref:Acyl-CoA thioester hydrolase n=1 Tax=Marihabitans asiaticum TaxID=415218 RepID=A0A560WEG3_9MICO|nr:acyl-CoA thioesterase [Marihabitans asiaticum]TWD16069.1 acyl-CoA thioester hydrolase [Marihabitans asiaticum]
MGEVHEVQIQARLRDINTGGHVDNVEAMRVLDEARIRFFGLGRRADQLGIPREPGLLDDLPDHVGNLVGAQRVDYLAEMRFAPIQPFRVRMWVGHVGTSSFTVESEIHTTAQGEGGEPAVVAESSVILWDRSSDATWRIDDTVRAVLTRYLGEPVPLRPRPSQPMDA